MFYYSRVCVIEGLDLDVVMCLSGFYLFFFFMWFYCVFLNGFVYICVLFLESFKWELRMRLMMKVGR